ncbi:MAG: enoyl-ACP reductase [Caldilineaceae bacterium]|nr:enoyl-ACP reductase [Caldilineaceae bacterium]MBP8108294.1 enoyl-ACP reductase [Caldilineaceae bacterium]MBP8123163.1 enoyl-ACP reductase [Caldilineaceae bacterium]MBP9073489.1 enoyl-ACP reductase [Caldilineaceae bacterium]
MGLFEGKKGLIFGVANKNSIAWGIAEALHEEGAELGFSYAGEILEKRVKPLAESIGSSFVEECDVTDDAAIDTVFAKAKEHFGTIDFLVHCVAYAPKEELGGRFVNTTRNGFRVALDISCYSLVALAARAKDLMPDGGAMIALTYFGAEKVTPNYNVMGVAKAALEASVRYLAWDLGKDGIRVNAISAGPIKTLAASGVSGFRKSLKYVGAVAPLGNVTQEDVGNAARYLLSDWASGVTGEVVYVDGGYNIMGAPDDEALEKILAE